MERPAAATASRNAGNPRKDDTRKADARKADPLRARDLMKTDVVTVSSSLPLGSLLTVFHEKGISGAPVLDAHGRLIGVVTLADVAERLDPSRPAALEMSRYFKLPDWPSPREFPKRGLRFLRTPERRATVADVCSPDVITAPTGATVEALANLMVDHRIHRILILDFGRLAGIVTSLDLVRLLGTRTPRRARTARRKA